MKLLLEKINKSHFIEKKLLLNQQDLGISIVEVSQSSLTVTVPTAFNHLLDKLQLKYNLLLNIFQIRHGKSSTSSIPCRKGEARINISGKVDVLQKLAIVAQEQPEWSADF